MPEERCDRELSFVRRAPILRACRDGPVSRGELERGTDSSRTTVYRATVDLAERGLLEAENGEYRTTAKGEALSHVVEEYLRGVEAVDRLEPLFEVVSHPELLENAHRLADATVTVADDDHVYRAQDRVYELWRQSDRVRMAAVAPGSRDCLREAVEVVVENEVDIELYYRPDARPDPEQMASVAFDPAAVAQHYETYVSEAIPFTFVLCDEVAAIAGHNEVSVPVVVAESDDPDVYEWLEGLFAECEARARPVREMTA